MSPKILSELSAHFVEHLLEQLHQIMLLWRSEILMELKYLSFFVPMPSNPADQNSLADQPRESLEVSKSNTGPTQL